MGQLAHLPPRAPGWSEPCPCTIPRRDCIYGDRGKGLGGSDCSGRLTCRRNPCWPLCSGDWPAWPIWHLERLAALDPACPRPLRPSCQTAVPVGIGRRWPCHMPVTSSCCERVALFRLPPGGCSAQLSAWASTAGGLYKGNAGRRC